MCVLTARRSRWKTFGLQREALKATGFPLCGREPRSLHLAGSAERREGRAADWRPRSHREEGPGLGTSCRQSTGTKKKAVSLHPAAPYPRGGHDAQKVLLPLGDPWVHVAVLPDSRARPWSSRRPPAGHLASKSSLRTRALHRPTHTRSKSTCTMHHRRHVAGSLP